MASPVAEEAMQYTHTRQAILTHASLINPSPYGELQLFTYPHPYHIHMSQACVVVMTRHPHQCRLLASSCAFGGEIYAMERLLHVMEYRTARILGERQIGEVWNIGLRRAEWEVGGGTRREQGGDEESWSESDTNDPYGYGESDFSREGRAGSRPGSRADRSVEGGASSIRQHHARDSGPTVQNFRQDNGSPHWNPLDASHGNSMPTQAGHEQRPRDSFHRRRELPPLRYSYYPDGNHFEHR
ncbi:uncharacterized protein K460DRAFT_153924 [Cucurbitaria berberidis CBS 394.84]|uniref:Uncharacterized protein n=1 Tax=Cucurbitaria berberidis CBS 394.84 TaxID=1168544 RepID=A0A9P4GEV2_9PLEO|nr:uncharacterized protein K460DRAFT_153924 [Cucurbitaria berberidis CBS 394.84]KAF1843910.1 hypothetical protein K460DRAFT_153924 [Cucurbitaria berberidis CBS 394.84]